MRILATLCVLLAACFVIEETPVDTTTGDSGDDTCMGEPAFCRSFLPNPGVTCDDGGYQCAIRDGGQTYVCCPADSHFYCGATNLCYVTAQAAATACQCDGAADSIGCVACNRP